MPPPISEPTFADVSVITSWRNYNADSSSLHSYGAVGPVTNLIKLDGTNKDLPEILWS